MTIRRKRGANDKLPRSKGHGAFLPSNEFIAHPPAHERGYSQRNVMKVVLVDRNDRVVGQKEKLEAHQHPVPLHRAISVVIRQKDQFLIQRRSVDKQVWPLYWSNACCTHPKPGEAYECAATRRLKEELGITCELKKVFNFIYQAKYDDVWGENELDWVFIGEYEGGVYPNQEEVAAWRWIGTGELAREIKAGREKYTPWFRLILDRLFRLKRDEHPG